MSIRNNILAGWGAHVVTVLIGFFLMPFIIATVGEAQYGAWVFINALAGYAGLVYAGFGATICRYVSDLSAKKEWARLNQFVSSIQAIYFVSAAIAILISCGFAWMAGFLDKWDSLPTNEVRISIMIVGTTIALGMIGSVYGGVLIGMQRLDMKHGIDVFAGVTRLVLVLVCLQQQFGLITLAFIFFAATLVDNIISAICAYRIVPTLSIAPWHTRKDVMKECFGFSAFTAIAMVAESLIFFTDTVVIGIILGPLAVVPYQIGQRIAQMIQVPVTQIGEAILPKAGELHAQQGHGRLAEVVGKGMSLAFLITGGFLIGSAYFGEMLIVTWIGKSYTSAALVLTILVGAQMVALPMVVARKALLGMGEVRVPAFIDLFEAGVNLLLSIILIQFMGIIGVALGTLFPIIVIELAIFLPYASRALSTTPRDLFHKIVTPHVPALAGLLLYCDLVSRLDLRTGWHYILPITIGGGVVLCGTSYLTHSLLQRQSRINLLHSEATAH